MPLHEWNTGQTWKDGGWQHYELDLRTWVFEEESFVPMALLLNGKAYSIVTDRWVSLPKRTTPRAKRCGDAGSI